MHFQLTSSTARRIHAAQHLAGIQKEIGPFQRHQPAEMLQVQQQWAVSEVEEGTENDGTPQHIGWQVLSGLLWSDLQGRWF
jgi:hypothetical protein